MARAVKLSRLGDALSGLAYPVQREAAAETLSDVTLLLADGERNLGEEIASCPSDSFGSPAELADEVRGNLPREAVGEPYQSEGEG